MRLAEALTPSISSRGGLIPGRFHNFFVTNFTENKTDSLRILFTCSLPFAASLGLANEQSTLSDSIRLNGR